MKLIIFGFLFFIIGCANLLAQSKPTYANFRDSFLRYEYTDTVKAKKFLDCMYNQSKKDKTRTDLTDYYMVCGWFAEDHSDFTSAMNWFRKSATLAKEIHSPVQEASAYGNMANIYDDLSEPGKCMEYHQRSLILCEQFLNSGNKDTVLRKKALENKSAAYGNISYLYKDIKNYKKSLEYTLLGMHIDSLLHNYDFLSTGFAAIGNIYKRTGKPDSALIMIRKSNAVKLAGAKKNKYINLDGLYHNYHAIGNIYKDAGNYDSALYYFKKSFDESEKSGDKHHQSFYYDGVGDIYLSKGNLKEAIRNFLIGFKLAQSLGSDERIYHSSLSLSKALEQAGDYRNAVKYLHIATATKDSLLDLEKIRASGKAEVQFQFKYKQSLDSISFARKMSEKDKIQDAENAQHLAEASRKNFILFGVMGILLVVSVFSVYLVRLYRSNKRATAIITEQKKTTDQHLLIIEEKQKEIVDSINYAKRIQYALLAHEEVMKNNLPDHFVLFKPKDIVSGDFYWYTRYKNEQNDFSFLAVCDSTGHGVPGAFMSLLNISFINEAITEKNILEPNEVFNHVRNRLIQNLGIEGQKDGFDGILLRLNHLTNKMDYAAANNSPVLVNENELKTLLCDKMPVGKGEISRSFNLFEIPNDFSGMLYLPTDGYADQFGGEKGKKLKFASLLKILKEINAHDFKKQSIILNERFENWKGNLEQVDDVCIIGVHVK